MLTNSSFLGTKNVHKLLFSLALPAVIAMVASGIYSILNTFIVAKGINIQAVGAIGIIFPIQILYHGFAQMISIGAASDISRSLGKKDNERARYATTHAFILTLVISIILMVMTGLFIQGILLMFGANQELLTLAQEYLNVLIWSIPFNAIVLLSSAILRAVGNLKQSMIVILLESILNIILDLIFIFYLNFGITGIAYATIISQAITTIYALYYIFRSKSGLEFKKEYLKPNLDISKSILKVGFSAFARNAATATLSIVINTSLRTLGGTKSLTAFGAVNRIVNFFFLPIMGVNQGMQPIASYNYGANAPERIKQVVKFSLIYTTAIGIIASLVGIFLSNMTLQIFIKETNILTEASFIFKLQLIFFWTMGFQTVTATLYQALGQALPALIISVFKQLFILIPLIYLLPYLTTPKLNGVWYAFPLGECLTFIIILIILRNKWKNLTPCAS